jgi:hypothetical protein
MARRPEWSFGTRALQELRTHEQSFPRPVSEIRAEYVGNMAHRGKAGSHPEELKHRSLRALPVVKYPGLAMYFLYASQGSALILVLHVALIRGAGASSGGSTSPHSGSVPPLPAVAWQVAQARLDTRDY